jgi:PAS domain S-box-containing protein
MKVLIADDDRVFRVLLKQTLTQWGYDVVAVENGEQACEQLSANTGPRLAILDWMMPKRNGVEVCERVRKSGRAHYVYMILLTGKNDSEDLMAGLEAGADDYIAKPVRFNELKLRLRSGTRVLEAQERQRVFAETASDGVITIEGRERIQFANHAAGAIFHCPPVELTGARFEDFVPGFQRRLEGTAPRSDWNEGCCSWPLIEMLGKAKSGGEMLLEVSFSEFLDHDRKQILTAVIRDVTERRQLERQLAQSQRLESIGQLAAGIAHEINTPIQYIGDNANFLDGAFQDLVKLTSATDRVAATEPSAKSDKELAYLCEEIPKAIQQMTQGVDHVARIVRAMKEFSHPGPVDKAPTDINRAIESTVLVSRNEWKYCADLTTDLDWELPEVPCIAGELKQVILNLIVNAAHAITDVVGATGRKGLIQVSTRQARGCAEIRIHDTGTGIPEAIRSKIFDPFFTTKEVGKGTGQGLAIAHSIIVQKHQGEITFETETGVGTTFCIRLPLGQEESDSQLAPVAAAIPA